MKKTKNVIITWCDLDKYRIFLFGVPQQTGCQAVVYDKRGNLLQFLGTNMDFDNCCSRVSINMLYKTAVCFQQVWTCGGSIEIHPCSHVGHIFRSRSPYKWERSIYETLLKNKARVAEVWMDEYKHIYYERINYSSVSALLICSFILYSPQELTNQLWSTF